MTDNTHTTIPTPFAPNPSMFASKPMFIAPDPTPVDIEPTESTEVALAPQKFMRKPFFVEAIQVTTENMFAVAAWVKGKVEEDPESYGNISFIRAEVLRPLNDRQTKAFVGDWILHSDTGFKIYTASAFSRCFVEPEKVNA